MGKFLLCFIVFAGLWYGRADAGPCNPAHTFITGEVLTAAVLNANPNNEKNCFGNIDSTNIGAAGINGSLITASSIATATFGGAFGYTFSNGLTVNGTAGLIVANVAGFNGGTASDNMGIYIGTASTDQGDAIHIGASQCGAQTRTSIGTTNTLGIGTSNNGQALAVFCNGALRLALTGNGGLAVTGTVQGANVSGVNNVTFLPPIYTSTGAAVASTLHGVVISCAATGGGSCTVTLSGAAVFASTTSFGCGGQNNSGNAASNTNVIVNSASSITLATNVTGTLSAICIGT